MKSSSQPQRISDAMFDRYLAGDATSEETTDVRIYLSRYPGAERLLRHLSTLPRREIAATSAVTRGFDPGIAWRHVERRIVQGSGPNPVSPAVRPSKRFPVRFIPGHRAAGWAAAAVVFMVTAVTAIMQMHSGTPFDSQTGTSGSVTRIFTTRPGQHRRVQLPDGSFVSLAPGTTLRYSDERLHTARLVELNGEALFTVIHSDGTPFIVRTGASNIRVLGTTFAVRRYTGVDSVTRVSVAQGKVAVNAQTVTSGEVAVAESTGSVHIERGADMSAALAWTTGSLVYRLVPLRTIIPDLERWYGITITAKDPRMLERQVSAVFLIGSPGEALDILESVTRGTVTRHGTRVTILPTE